MYEMDAVDHRGLDTGFSARAHRASSEPDRTSDQAAPGPDGDCGEGGRLVCVSLFGGAPWGFTLRGGLEHREPLIITKVEEGSKAAAVKLQAGDELININEIPLSGYRQEAICLVKGSHKTLTLVVKRKNEPMSRPHSWHSTKFSENQSDAAKPQSTPSPAWKAKYDASSYSSDLTPGWNQTNLRRASDQFSSLGSMDSLEHGAHPYPPGRLSPNKSNGNSIEHLGGGKRDSAYSSFSTSSGTPDYTLSKSNAASTENMLYKVNHWDSGSRPSNGRHSQSLGEAVRHDDRHLQPPTGTSDRDSPRTEEQPGHQHSASARASIGPVWHIPDMKKNKAPSPPPPAPPLRSDSFAATKIHEKGLASCYVEGSGGHSQSKLQGKGPEMATEVSENTQKIYQASQAGLETCQNYNAPLKSDSLNSHVAADMYNSNRGYSLSNDEVKAGHPSFSRPPYHQRQYSDESTFYAPSRTASASKSQNMGCYSSMQELPTNSPNQHYSQNQIRKSVASLFSTSVDQNPDIHGSGGYHGVSSRLHLQGFNQGSAVRTEDKNANFVIEMTQSGGDRTSFSSQAPNKDKYSPPRLMHYPNNKDSNGHYRQLDSQHRVYPAGNFSFEEPTASDVRGIQKQNIMTNTNLISYPSNNQSEQARFRSREPSQEPLPSKIETPICPQKTPMLHSLSQDNTRQADTQSNLGNGDGQQETIDLQNGRQLQRPDRFATTLRNEILMRRAQLQKSRSAAVLSESGEPEEEPSVWKSTENNSSCSSDGSFTSTYKDHLKEAQARVLKATSFRRRDLEPVLLEHPGPEIPTSSRKDAPSLPSVSESQPVRPVLVSNHVARICGRKRIPVEKKARSYSEPDKINEVGFEEAPTPQDSGVSLASRRKVFEVTGKPAYCKPMPKQIPQMSEDSRMTKPVGKLPYAQSDVTKIVSSTKATDDEKSQGHPNSSQRLGTFAEYEATWKTQRKAVDQRTSGRYHSADNILDPGVEERHKPSYFHERSRSSPSDDFYGPNIQVPGRKSAEYPPPERELYDHGNSRSGISDGGHKDLGSKQTQEPPAAHLVGGDIERNHPDTVSPKSPPNPVGPSLQFDDHSILTESLSLAKNKSSVSQRPPLPRLDKSKCPEVTTPPATSQGGFASSPSPVKDTVSAYIHTPEHSRGPMKEEEPQPEAMPLSPAEPTTHLTPPTMDGQRSPSPHFAPQRLTDKPPVSVSLQDEATGRMEKMIEDNSTVKKVPIKIVHSESNTEKENRLYLYPNTETPPSSQEATLLSLSSLGAPEQSSPFCTYTRQREQGNETLAAQKDEPHADSSELQQKGPCVDQSRNGVGIGAPPQTEEDEKTEVLTRDIIDKDKSLADILDQSKRRTTMDLMEGIFPEGEQLVEEAHQRKRAAPKLTSARSEERREEDSMAAAALVTSSAYYSTSAPKAELLIKMKDMQEQSVELDSEEELEEETDTELANKKHELIESLSRKLQVLREARESLQEDVQDNNALGQEVESTVQTVCKPNELEKFRMFVGDLDKVVSLLLSLSGRLARVENALNSLEEDAPLEERRTLMDKRKLLIRQHEDAKELKENLDRREKVVYDILASYLPEESMADYEHFVKMKSALIIEQRKLEDKIKLGEEQLKCLVDSLPLEQRPRY